MSLTRESSPIVQKIMQKTASPTEMDIEEEITEGPEGSQIAAGPDLEPEPDMATLMAEYDVSTKKGQVVAGRVVSVSNTEVIVDIGTKSDGHIPFHELGPEDDLSPGDAVEVIVVKPETEESGAILSKRQADYEKHWSQLIEAHETGKVIEALVKDIVRGGLVADLGVESFIPASHVATKKRDLSIFIGQVLRCKIIDVDRKRRRLILSNRLAVEEEREKKKGETWSKLEEGAIIEGVVRRLTDFGAFVDLGGIDALLHVREMSWTHLHHPSEAVKVGDKFPVLILEIDRRTEKISVGRKQLLPDPWKKAVKTYRTGKVVKGTVTRIVPSGAFVHLEEGIDGIIPVGEISEKRISSPEEVLSIGQEVEVKVKQVSAKQRRMTLSFKEAERDKEKREFRDYMDNQKSGAVTLGDVFGSLLANANVAEAAGANGPESSAAVAENEGDASVAEVAEDSALDDLESSVASVVEESVIEEAAPEVSEVEGSSPAASEEASLEVVTAEVEAAPPVEAAPDCPPEAPEGVEVEQAEPV